MRGSLFGVLLIFLILPAAVHATDYSTFATLTIFHHSKISRIEIEAPDKLLLAMDRELFERSYPGTAPFKATVSKGTHRAQARIASYRFNEFDVLESGVIDFDLTVIFLLDVYFGNDLEIRFYRRGPDVITEAFYDGEPVQSMCTYANFLEQRPGYSRSFEIKSISTRSVIPEHSLLPLAPALPLVAAELPQGATVNTFRFGSDEILPHLTDSSTFYNGIAVLAGIQNRRIMQWMIFQNTRKRLQSDWRKALQVWISVITNPRANGSRAGTQFMVQFNWMPRGSWPEQIQIPESIRQVRLYVNSRGEPLGREGQPIDHQTYCRLALRTAF